MNDSVKETVDFTFTPKTAGVEIVISEAPWDSAVFNTRVLQVERFQAKTTAAGEAAWREVSEWMSSRPVEIMSCRLPHDRMREAMILENHGFRFIEMVLHPQLDLQKKVLPRRDGKVVVEDAEEEDRQRICEIAASAFGVERYHMDPRIDSGLADERYRRWANSSFNHDSQQMFKVVYQEKIIGFFLVEDQPAGHVYWHLTAMAPEWQGQGLGYHTWVAMLHKHREDGWLRVSTTISARNSPVLNLYAKLGFRFQPPEMTFHWVKASS
jgi:RimJ/RimL family protein N-acetyltransferase